MVEDNSLMAWIRGFLENLGKGEPISWVVTLATLALLVFGLFLLFRPRRKGDLDSDSEAR